MNRQQLILTASIPTLRLGMRAIYRYRAENFDYLPSEGPYILLVKEGGGPLSTVGIALIFYQEALAELMTMGDMTVVTAHEDVMARLMPAAPDTGTASYPLRPHGAGTLSVGLIHQLQVLRKGGVAIMNPEGDLSWDGRPLPIRRGAAWLGLHSGAPLVPVSCSVGGYDAWPLWQKRPSFRGRVVVRMGSPFRLTEAPMIRASEEDMAAATERIGREVNALFLGDDDARSVAEWAGPPLRDGKVVAKPATLKPAGPIAPVNGSDSEERNWGIAMLLWACPVCHTNDALVQERALLHGQRLRCRACGTVWRVRHVVARDFRLQVVKGHPDLIGLDMALTDWYDQMMDTFQPTPIAAPPDLLGGDEELFLAMDDAKLLPHDPNPLGDDWSPGEAPRAHPGGQSQKPGWSSVGTGRLYLTSERLIWESERGTLEFLWPVMRSVFLPWRGLFGITYGSALYRFDVSPQPARKWLTYAGTLARHAAAAAGHPITLSPF